MDQKVAIVTGGGSGMGRATCERLVREGFDLATFELDEAQAVEAAGPTGLGLGVDVSDPDAVERGVAAVLEQFGRIDVLVNNAGIGGGPAAGRCHETPVEVFDRVQAVNVRGPFLCSRAVLPTMLAQGSGHIITVASVASMVNMPGRCAYTTSKGGALQLSRSIGADYAADGIRANAICPGWVDTPLTARFLDDPERRAAIEKHIPIGRVAQPEEIAEAVWLLAAGHLAYMNGAALVIDGAWTISPRLGP